MTQLEKDMRAAADDPIDAIKEFVKERYPNQVLFRVEVGNLEGLSKWVRKQNYNDFLDAPGLTREALSEMEGEA